MRKRKVVFAHVKDVQNKVDYVKQYGDIVSDSSCVRQCMCFGVYIVKQIYNVCTLYMYIYIYIMYVYVGINNLYKVQQSDFGRSMSVCRLSSDSHFLFLKPFALSKLQHSFAKGRTDFGPCAAAVDRHPHRSMPKPPQSDGTSSASDFLR